MRGHFMARWEPIRICEAGEERWPHFCHKMNSDADPNTPSQDEQPQEAPEV
jgi:hypothetical protein